MGTAVTGISTIRVHPGQLPVQKTEKTPPIWKTFLNKTRCFGTGTGSWFYRFCGFEYKKAKNKWLCLVSFFPFKTCWTNRKVDWRCTDIDSAKNCILNGPNLTAVLKKATEKGTPRSKVNHFLLWGNWIFYILYGTLFLKKKELIEMRSKY